MWSLLVLCLVAGTNCLAETVYEALQNNQEFSKFFELVNKDKVLPEMLQKKTATVFAPTSSAIEAAKWITKDEDKIAAYHVAITLAMKSSFPTHLSSYSSGAPPLQLTLYENEDTGKTEYFVNNAKIIGESTYFTEEGMKQLLYVIDDIMELYIPKNNLPPTALSLLKQPKIYDISKTFEVFVSRTRSVNEEELFQRVGQHTYFLPQGHAKEQNYDIQQEIDKWVIRGHVIPNHVLFTRTMGRKAYRSEAYEDNLKVKLSLINRTNENDDGYTLYIQSNTIQSDYTHRKGVVYSKILHANIPVANGVVHIIEVPLMIIEKTIWQILEEEKNNRFSKFYNLIKDQPEFIAKLQSSLPVKTLFIPSNDAISSISDEKFAMLKENDTEFSLLLGLHLVFKSISTEEVLTKQIVEERSFDNRRGLYFRVVGDKNKSRFYTDVTLTVEGGGVNATVIEADIGATNGMVHIINRVLGMPSMTVYEKLESDPDLRTTFNISHLDDWNWQLMDKTKQYTFFCPAEEAWKFMSIEMPTSYKQMRMTEFPHHVHKILDRHLMIGEELSTQELVNRGEIQMIHGIFKVEQQSVNVTTVEWEGKKSRIIKANVQATNGVIHVIDRVMMKPRDLKKGGAYIIAASHVLINICLLTAYMLF
ncbi:fasciclin-1 isoform X1 [Centruroides vittatus]|uniref:fasciclin-1 isoform X1 n=1 Tax=Centruroides vittatus TaxID=120091 RepID=UPI00351085ED